MINIPMIKIEQCWCGSQSLKQFSEHYFRCGECYTLVRSERMPGEYYDSGFYGNEYWVKYIKEAYGHDIYQHARSYLTERCVFWLRDILKYRLPPSETLEVGCGHGGLVFLMNLAGYESAGADLSQWICDYGQKTFDIPVIPGSIQDLQFPDESFDMIILMDVLEHLPSPAENLRRIASLLKKDGIVVLQTPCLKDPDLTFEELSAASDLFLQHLEPKEHLFLFNQASLARLLKETGFGHIEFEDPIFPYDMFAFGGKQPLTKNDRQSIEEWLLRSSRGRIILSLIDSFEQVEQKEELLEACESDRTDRLEALVKTSDMLQEVEADRAARLEVIQHLSERISNLENEVKDLRSSISWKITSPLRYVFSRLKRN